MTTNRIMTTFRWINCHKRHWSTNSRKMFHFSWTQFLLYVKEVIVCSQGIIKAYVVYDMHSWQTGQWVTINWCPFCTWTPITLSLTLTNEASLAVAAHPGGPSFHPPGESADNGARWMEAGGEISSPTEALGETLRDQLGGTSYRPADRQAAAGPLGGERQPSSTTRRTFPQTEKNNTSSLKQHQGHEHWNINNKNTITLTKSNQICSYVTVTTALLEARLHSFGR